MRDTEPAEHQAPDEQAGHAGDDDHAEPEPRDNAAARRRARRQEQQRGVVARGGAARPRDSNGQRGAVPGRELQPAGLDPQPAAGGRHPRSTAEVERVPGDGRIDEHSLATRVADVDRRAPRRGNDDAGRPCGDAERHGGEGNRRDHRAITVNVTPAE